MNNNETHVSNPSSLYKSNCEFARRLKERWLSKNDPILQRDNKYIPQHKQTQQCKLNYFERMKQKEEQTKQHKQSFKNNNNCRSLFTESSEPKYKCHKKRVFTPESNFVSKRHDNKGIRVFPLTYKNEQITNILTRDSNSNSNNNENAIRRRTCYKPSEGYVRMNDKRMFLPFENRMSKKDSVRGCSGNVGSVNKEGSKERIFGISNSSMSSNATHTNHNSEVGHSKVKCVHKNNVKLKTDHVNDIITYKYGPAFKEEQLTSKPNTINYSNILSKHRQNIQNDYLYI